MKIMPNDFKQFKPEPEQEAGLEENISKRGDRLSLTKGSLQSRGYVRGRAGWRIQENGIAEFRDVRLHTRQLTVSPGQSIQGAVDKLEEEGGGIILLESGTHTISNNISITDNIWIQGQTIESTIIDFGSTANQLKIEGTDAYLTGTVSISNGGVTVTGSGTSWSSNVTVGQDILLDGIWYPVTAVGSDTSITISIPYAGEDLSGASYIVATPREGIIMENLTIKSSNLAGIKAQYAKELVLFNVAVQGSAVGLDFDDISNLTLESIDITACNTGYQLTNVHFSIFTGSGSVDALTGIGADLDTVTNSAFNGFFVLNSAGDGIQFTSCKDLAMNGVISSENGGIGMEFVSGNDRIALNSSGAKNNTSDGIKLTATSDNVNIVGNPSITGNGGYGVNIAASSCDKNIVVANNLTSNSSGAINDAGTGTISANNAT